MGNGWGGGMIGHVKEDVGRISALQHIRNEIDLLLGIADCWDAKEFSIFPGDAAAGAEAAVGRAGGAMVEA